MKNSPREFMKMRRPERYSDTTVAKKGMLNRSLLEYKLGVITSNSQEQEFQTFCVKLAQVEIVPNLRLQTGPTGGGDSKADSETYPVSEYTSLNYWEGLSNELGERWALAISAKEDWISKVKHDVEGIAGTGRDYKRIFFITSQFAKDKKRAELEDSLSHELLIPVTILDRTWILDRVFLKNRQKLAIEELRLGEGLEDEIIVGPTDAQRIKKFAEINKEIEDALSHAVVTTEITNKALEMALLARGMEKSKMEVDGLFDRAIKLATKLNSEEQIFSIKYEKAWATFFWFEDFDSFIRLYEELEPIAANSANIFTLERLNNLTSLLRAMVVNGYPFGAGYVEQKINSIKSWLNAFANDETKPSAAQQAKIILAIEQLFDNAVKKADLNPNFIEIGHILKGTERLIGFPYETIIELIQENGDVFGDIPEYEKLINLIIELDTKRKGEIPASKTLLNYGLQHLEAGRYYKAIDYIGRSLIGLYKKESKKDFIHGLYFIAYAYDAVGLLWAARGSLIHAASYATSDYRQSQEVDEIQYKCCRRLKTIELRLGRIGYVLEWHEADLVLSQQLATSREEQETALLDATAHFVWVLGCLLLKTLPQDLPKLEQLPKTLERLALDVSAMALLYQLGGETYLPKEFREHIGEQPIADFFNYWTDQPANNELPKHPDYYLAEKITLHSNILGTHFIFETKNSSPGIEICEMIAAALEAYLSTAIIMQAFGKLSELKVEVEENSDSNQILQLSNLPADNKCIKVNFKLFNPHLLSVELQEEINNALSEIIIRIISEAVGFADTEKTLKELIVNQRVEQRSFNFSSPLVMLGNVLGHNPKRSITQWIDAKAPRHVFDGNVNRIQPPTTPTNGATPSENDESEIRGHQFVKTISVIREDLWAGWVWKGFAFAIDPSPYPLQSPTLYLMFDEREKATAIFKDWKDSLGDKVSEMIRISILKGIDVDHPHWYKGLIGTNPYTQKLASGITAFSLTQISTMTPANPRNLEGFLESFAKFGYYNLAPCYIDHSNRPEIFNELGFVMKEITVRNAWEVGLNDIDMTGIVATDNPYIPEGKSDAPVQEVLKLKRREKA